MTDTQTVTDIKSPTNSNRCASSVENANVNGVISENGSSSNVSFVMPAKVSIMSATPTLNQYGYMFDPDQSTESFIYDVIKNSSAEFPGVEIGACYGAATIPAIQGGATMIANDLDSRHLEILRNRLTVEEQKRLLTIKGSFPDQVKLGENNVSAVLVANVFHYFNGSSIEQSLADIYRALVTNGRVYISVGRPVMGNNPIMEELVDVRRNQGIAWPGWVNYNQFTTEWLKKPETIKSITSKEYDYYTQITTQGITDYFNLMSMEDLVNAVERAGFEIEFKKIETFDKSRRNMNVIAKKIVYSCETIGC